MRLPIAAKIGILVGIQITLTVVSFSYLSHISSSNSLLGNTINIAGKSRLLTASVLLESQYYISGIAGKAQVEKSVSALESNILLVRYGGTFNDIKIDSLQSDFQSQWDAVYEDYTKLKAEADQLTSTKSLSAFDSSQMRTLGANLISSSDSLVNSLSASAENNSMVLVKTQIALGGLNISLNSVILMIILRLLRPIKLLTGAIAEVKHGNFQVSVPVTGNDELSDLTLSFGNMVRSINDYSNSVQKEKRKYQDLYNYSPDPYRTVDINGMIQDCNPAYVKAFGYSTKDELIGTSILETTADSSIDAMRDSLETWKARGHVENRKIEFKRKDGSTFPGVLSATTVPWEDGQPISSNTCIIDLTEINKTSQQLEKANIRLRELDIMKTEFISVASHELRTPIQPIIGSIFLARRGKISNEKALEVIGQQAQRLLALVNDILDVVRLEDEKILQRNERFSVSEVIRLITAGRISSDSDIKLNLDLATDPELMIDADRSRITQVFSNIFENALKFTKSGLIQIIAKRVMTGSGGRIEIFLADSGPGIPDVMLPNLFTKFATQSVNGGAQQGTGLGLYICKKILLAHNGSIIAGNTSSGGAAFKITLPICVADNIPDSKTSFAEPS